MKVLFVASECAPIIKVGGLADVVGSLPKALKKLGVDVSVVIPKYDEINVETQNLASLPGTDIPLYLIPTTPGPIYDMPPEKLFERYTKFSQEAVKLIKINNYDIVHLHDWHTCLAIKPEFKSVLTIHNLAMGTDILREGIQNADIVTTVSPTYAKEIQTPEFGEGLDGVLRENSHKLFGILNGIDYDIWNPATDKYLTKNYTVSLRVPPKRDEAISWQEGKKRNKIKLLQAAGLPIGENVPTFGMISRLTTQKGLDILIPALEKLLSSQDMRVIILGMGDPGLELSISKLEFEFKQKLKLITRFDEALAHLIYAGSDFMLVPSKFEPCGLTQMIAMRYGTIPIVRKTGGLADTVEDGVDGFVFEEYSSQALLAKINEAYNRYNNYNDYNIYSLVSNAMKKDFSWDKSAKKYLEIYRN